MKIPDIESALRLIADLDAFSGAESGGELSFQDLEWVSAAMGHKRISLEELLRKKEEKTNKKL